MPAKPPVITLTTDFGLTDHFAGTMKGVIAGITPAARVIDICHQVTPFEILEGGFVLEQAYRYFPKGTIHVVVIDPGVGTSRRPILVEAGNQFFIGPDNGVFTLIYAAEAKHKVRVITASKYFLETPSNTFHGRDIFAPCAAHLASGKVKPAQLGPLIKDYTQATAIFPNRTGKRVWTGQVLKVDHFGNLITNLRSAEFHVGEAKHFELLAGSQIVSKFAKNYQESAFGELFVIEGSSGYLEVSVCQGSAAKQLGCGAGAPLELSLW
jgi:S-adenosylmethionine hydrolase